MVTFVVLMVLVGVVGAFAVTEAERSQRATDAPGTHRGETDATAVAGTAPVEPEPIASEVHDDGDDSPEEMPTAPPVVEARVTDAPPVETRPDEPEPARIEAPTNEPTTAEPPVADQPVRPVPVQPATGARRTVLVASVAELARGGMPTGQVGDAPPERTALQGPLHVVADAPLWRRGAAAVGLVVIVFGLSLLATAAVFIGVAVAAEVLSNAV